jgi:guanyl-specific ribonuclease Sa
MPNPAYFSRRPSNVWLRLVLAAVAALVVYSAWKQQQLDRAGPRRPEPAPAAQQPPASDRQRGELEGPSKAEAPLERAPGHATIVARQEIRDQDGRILFRGDIDLAPTLDRIERGERLSYAHDGTTFQNRERRLPARPAGYYREYVHPTAKVAGPGPQRVVVGREGETYYTPDHYRTFRRIDTQPSDTR